MNTSEPFVHKNCPLRVAQKISQGRVAIQKPMLSQKNVSTRLELCMAHRNWFLEQFEQWKGVISFDELSFFLFPTTGRVYVWGQLKEAFPPDCLQPTVNLSTICISIYCLYVINHNNAIIRFRF